MVVFEVKEMMLGMRDSFGYFQCQKCESLQICDVPDNLGDYYPDDYYSFHGEARSSFLYKLASGMRNHYAVYNRVVPGKWIYRYYPNPSLRSLRPLKPEKTWRILDIGCGYGEVLLHLKSMKFQNLEGIDPYLKEEISHSVGLKIRNIGLDELEGKWDLVMLHHSFEHLEDPENTLKHIFRLLADDGRCIIRTPNLSSHAWRKYCTSWVQIDAPRHIVIHSTKSMKILCEKTGFVLFEMIDDSDGFQFWGSEQYLKDIALHEPGSYFTGRGNSIFSRETLRRFQAEAEELNRRREGDQTVFYLKKQTMHGEHQHLEP